MTTHMSIGQDLITEHFQGSDLGAHRHSHAYSALVLEGGYIECGVNGTWLCEPGDIVFHPPFDLHSNRFVRSRTLVLNFTYSTNSARLLEHLEYGVFRELDADEFIRRGNDVDAVIDLLAKAASGPRNNASDWVEIMAADLRRDPKLQISDAAARHDISPEHASRAFRRRYGITPSRFRAEEQLQHAIRLLCDKSMTLAEIAQIVGYCDQAHFTRQLVSAIGIAPSALREFIA